MLKLLMLSATIFLLSTRCRKNAEAEALRGWAYAHRGLHGNGIPENSMAAFRAALEHGYGIEFDLHLLRDGNLAVMHDSLLNRTTGQPGRLEDLCTEDLHRYQLGGTEETIPLFSQVLELFQGRAPLIIELKSEDGNHQLLAETACRMLDGYRGLYCIESFDPKVVAAVRKLRPQVIRGQLSADFLKSRNDMSNLSKFLMTHCMTNFVTVPDFIAYEYGARKGTPTNWLCKHLWKAQRVSWTLRSQAEYDTAAAEGWIPIFEGFCPVPPVRDAV